MEQKHKILFIILAACGLLYFVLPESGYRAEIAKREQPSLAELKAKEQEYAALREKSARELKMKEEQEARAKQQAAQRAAEAEAKALAEAQAAEAASVAAAAANFNQQIMQPTRQIVNATPSPKAYLGQPLVNRDVAAVSRALPMQPQLGAQAVVSVSKTNFATRFLYLRLKGRVLRFDVSKEISDSELDSLVKVLANTCLTTTAVDAKCRSNLIVDRSFYAVANRLSDDSFSTDGWNLECIGSLGECLNPKAKQSKFMLSQNYHAGTKSVAKGFVAQTVAAKNLVTLSASNSVVIDKVYVTRMAAR